MNYSETIKYLYEAAPLFQNIGAGAYKEGLSNTHKLDAHFGHPHTKYKTIHIAGTNGKGSCASALAAILQSQGYKTGLYTSPHLVDFRERIRVNGKMIPEQEVIDFVAREREFFEPLHPSFFELTTALAFEYFAKEKVDFAVIEVGMGGRLDCTNIITPEVSVITNISLDHTQFLGDTIEKIAAEKAGIIKESIPVVIGENQAETRPVFERKAKEMHAPVTFAEDSPIVLSWNHAKSGSGLSLATNMMKESVHFELSGDYEAKNANTVLTAVKILRSRGTEISDEAILNGLAHISSLTGLRARWEIIRKQPTVILDTGHNPGGLTYNMQQLTDTKHNAIRIIVGMVSDKDVAGSLRLMPKNAVYYFTKASVKRALDENTLYDIGTSLGLAGKSYPCVADAFKAAMSDAGNDDVIYVGGSNFIVGDFLATVKSC